MLTLWEHSCMTASEACVELLQSHWFTVMHGGIPWKFKGYMDQTLSASLPSVSTLCYSVSVYLVLSGLVCLGLEHAQSLEGADCVYCEQLPLRMLCSCLALWFGSRICLGNAAAQVMGVANGAGKGAWDGSVPFSAFTCWFQRFHSGTGSTLWNKAVKQDFWELKLVA